MIVRMKLTAAFLLLFVVAAAASNAQVKLGTVDSKTIVSALDEFEQIEAQVAALQKSMTDTLQALKLQFDQAFQNYQTNMATMDAETKKQAEGQLQQMQTTLQQYQVTRFGDQGILISYQQQLQEPIRQKVLSAIRAVAKQLGLNVVMEETGMLYVDTSMDITFKVLEYLKNQG